MFGLFCINTITVYAGINGLEDVSDQEWMHNIETYTRKQFPFDAFLGLYCNASRSLMEVQRSLAKVDNLNISHLRAQRERN